MKTSLTHSPRASMGAPLFALLPLLLLSVTGSLSAHDGHHQKRKHCPQLRPQTILQLDHARQAAGRFFDVQAALDAGYETLELHVPHMGWHYINYDHLNGRFDPAKPPLLVYQEDCNGKLRLAALEYAVPTEGAPRPPRGFIGDDDVWDNNTTFKLWTLHAWVYDYNPDGVFAPHNMRLP